MSSGEDYLKKVKSEMGLLEKIMSYIPGYRGYKQKELRRESDRLIRMEAVNRLKDAKAAIRRSMANPFIIQKMSGEDTWRVDALMSRLDRVIQRIDKAVAGYAGMFDAVKVREDKLDVILEHDLKLIESANNLKKEVENILSMEPGVEEWRKAIDGLMGKVEELDKLVDERIEILRGLAE